MTFKAFIFDFDGTLSDSLSDLAHAINYSLATQNFPTFTVDEVRQKIGHGIDRLIIDALPHKYRDNNKIIAQSLKLMSEHYASHWQDNTKLFDDISDVLDQMTINKIKMAILSNKPEQFLKEMVDFLVQKWDFQMVVGGRNDYPLKPNPTSTLEIIKTINLDPKDIAFVGDGDTDIHTAIAAGITPIAVTWGYRSKKELEAAGATIFIDTPKELLSFI
ncbi:MAG: HAD family hydrolase [Brevinema sp.]